MEQHESYLPAIPSDVSQTTIAELIDKIDRLPGPQQIEPLMQLLQFVWNRSAEAEALLLRRLISHPYSQAGLAQTQSFLYQRLAYVLWHRPDLCLPGLPWEGQECHNRALQLTGSFTPQKPNRQLHPVWVALIKLAEFWLRTKVAKRASK